MAHVSTGPWRMKPPLESVWRDTAEPVPTDPLELDERARALAAERLDFDLAFGPLLARLHRHRVWWEFRCGSWDEYVTEWLGLSVRTVRQKLWLERRMMELPEIRMALRSGKLTYTKALFVAREASPEDVAERIALAASTTVEQVERESSDSEDRQNRAAGVRRLWGPEDAFETVSMAIGSCQQWFRECGEVISVGEALARMADHFVSVWREEVEREKKRASKRRREVLLRNRGFCAFPGCTRAAEHDHHVTYRSRGGSDEVWNRLGLCVAHHLRAIHGGFATVRGVAGERLVWEFGSGERFVTVGDEEVRRSGQGR